MCAKINLYKPVGEMDKNQVPPVETVIRLTVENCALENVVTRWVKPQGSNVQTGMRKREGIELRETTMSVVAELLCGREGNINGNSSKPIGTTGVRDLGMYGRFIQELGRSSLGSNSRYKTLGQEVMFKSEATPFEEVRWNHSSKEVG